VSEAHPPAAPDPSPAAAASLEERYGSGKRQRFDRRFAWLAVVALLIAGLAYLFLSGWQESGQVQSQDIGFDKQSDREVSVKFTVTAPVGARVACAVEALSVSKAVVGWRIVEVPVSDRYSHTVTTKLLTTTPATAAHARECWIVEAPES